MSMFWVVTLCELTFRRNTISIFGAQQYVSPKRWYRFSSPFGITTHDNTDFFQHENLKYYCSYCPKRTC
jgi:hypothetical protein